MDSTLAGSGATATAASNPKKKRWQFLQRFVFLSPQITILTIVAVVLVIALIVLAFIVVAQVQASAEVLTFNDTNRVFVQIQRETLRLAVLVAQPIDEFKDSDVQTQSDLIESRIGVMNFPTSQASLPPQIKDKSQQIQQKWLDLKPQIQAWKADPSNAALQDTLRQSLVDFEFLTNDTEVNYSRFNVAAINDFAQLSRQQLLVFAIGALILVAFMFIVAISIYRFSLQKQEVEAAREASRLKDEFLAVVSHELRTPLNAIIGFLGIMKMAHQLDQRSMHMVERAHANAVRLLSLINDILDVSKIEAGKFELMPTTIPIRKLIERWQAQMDILAKQKDIDFRVHVDEKLPETVFVDDEAMTKIVTNLLSNAFKFTDKGSVSLDVIQGKPDEWVITVTDTGIGIPDEAKAYIFEDFRQVKNSSQQNYGGTGLGLSIVKRLCLAMGGNVEVESIPGKGSTFTIKMPLKLPVQPQVVQPA